MTINNVVLFYIVTFLYCNYFVTLNDKNYTRIKNIV